jgi:c-di-GMP-binding flagellar brake protein YcgR
MTEKRKYPRINSIFNVEILSTEGGTGISKNISEGGFLFSHNKSIELGRVLKLNLQIQGLKGNFTISGEVVRCQQIEKDNNYDIALKFVEVDEKINNNLKKFIQSQNSNEI